MVVLPPSPPPPPSLSSIPPPPPLLQWCAIVKWVSNGEKKEEEDEKNNEKLKHKIECVIRAIVTGCHINESWRLFRFNLRDNKTKKKCVPKSSVQNTMSVFYNVKYNNFPNASSYQFIVQSMAHTIHWWLRVCIASNAQEHSVVNGSVKCFIETTKPSNRRKTERMRESERKTKLETKVI